MQSHTPMQLLKLSFFALLTLTLIFHALVSYIPNFHFKPKILMSLSHHRAVLFTLLWCTPVALLSYLSTRPRPVFLLDYSCFKPDADRKYTYEVCEYFGLLSGRFSPESGDFMRAIYCKSGLGDETYGPPFSFLQPGCDARHRLAGEEVEEGMFSAVASLLSKTDVRPSQISVLIVAASAFSPSPSLSSFLVHRFSLPPNVKTYSLAGMGCCTGTMLVDLAARILRRDLGYALIVATDSTGHNWYYGNNRHMLITNCIFRVGTVASLLTSDPSRRHAAKMELVRTLRTHHGADDASYNAAIQQEDAEGTLGIALSKDLIRVAGAGLRDHIATLAPRVLPASELVRYVCAVTRSFLTGDRKAEHVPDFTAAFEHMSIHAGGKAVIDAVGKLMRLGEEVTEPGRMCLHRFGNTSSSLVFYELAYMEAKMRIRVGDRVWMLGFGSGFKACSVVWRALRDSCMDSDNPWEDCINRYPVGRKGL